MLRCAVVGLGWWGSHIVAKLNGAATLSVVATVDVDPQQRPTTTDVADVLHDDTVDAIVVAVPHSLHADLIASAAAAGKHVFCEKPLTLTAASAREAVDACARHHVVLGVGHERRFEPSMTMLHRAVHAGDLGTVLHAEAAFNHNRFVGMPADHWRGAEREAPAAGITAMGVHLTDLFISLFGPVVDVHAHTARRVLPLPSGDVVSVHLRFRDGVIGSVSAVSATPFYGRLAVFGSDAWVEVRDDAHPEAALGASVTTCRRGEVPVTRHVDATGDAVVANLRAWAAAALGGPPYPVSSADLVHNVAVLEATARSARTGRSVAMTGDLAWTGS
jgi:predicted dehydrogenase